MFVKLACYKILYNLISHCKVLNNNVYENRIFGVIPDIFARKRIFYLTLNRLAGQRRAAHSMEIYARAPPPLSRRGRENSVDGYGRQLRRLYLGPLRASNCLPFVQVNERYTKIVDCWAHRNQHQSASQRLLK